MFCFCTMCLQFPCEDERGPCPSEHFEPSQKPMLRADCQIQVGVKGGHRLSNNLRSEAANFISHLARSESSEVELVRKETDELIPWVLLQAFHRVSIQQELPSVDDVIIRARCKESCGYGSLQAI